MKEKIDKTLKRFAENTPAENSPTSSNTSREPNAGLPGDPECPICGGVGFLRLDVPFGHPQFGKLQICSCRQQDVSRQVRQRLFDMSHLDELRHLTFENFQPRGAMGLSPQQAGSVETAFNMSRQFAQSLNGWLLLQGTYGSGKTHLAAAVANFAVEIGVPTLFVTVPDLLDSLRFSYQSNDTSFEQRFEEIRNAPLLVLDDFGTQNATPWAQEKLFQIINYRYINHLPMVITTNLRPGQIEERINSRLQDPKITTRVHILAPDFRRPLEGDLGHPELSSLRLMSQRTFANFDSRRSERLPTDVVDNLERALKTAYEFAEQPRGWLLFTGPYGSGKTHLAAAIANYRSEVDTPPLFIVVPDLLDHLRATFSPQSQVTLDRRFEEVRTARLLILDDLGTQSTTPWVGEKLYQLFNYRYNAELPTVITTANSIGELNETHPRLASRMLDRRICTIFAIQAPPYRGTPPEQKSSRDRRRR